MFVVLLSRTRRLTNEMDDILTFVRLSRALLLSGRSGDPQAQQEERDLKDWHRLYALLVTETLTHQSHLLSSPVALETVCLLS